MKQLEKRKKKTVRGTGSNGSQLLSMIITAVHFARD
jgi:hypothetical protein